MNTAKGTYCKALVLLLVFSLNTVVSFACSLGGMFHSFHHSSSVSGKKQHTGHQAGHEKMHHHHNDHDSESESEKDDCCSSSILKIETLEKSVSRSIEAPNAIFLTSLVSSFITLSSLLPAEEKTLFPHHIRWRLPATIQDLRIVIQSFQI